MKLIEIKKYVAELIGTFVLVLFGCGTAIVLGCGTLIGGTAATVGTALAFGLVIVAMAFSIGNISGCHINPAVSLAMLINKKLSFKDFVFYVIAQVGGAILGALLLLLFFGKDSGFGANSVSPTLLDGNAWMGLIAEIILTFVFVLAIMGVTSKSENVAVVGIVIGLTLVLVHLFGIPMTGTSVNPARSLGPALFAGGVALEQIWIFILGPLVGGALAALCYKFLSKE
ncbi:MAG: MIP/aquaporin family protein [Bacilli bacterium]